MTFDFTEAPWAHLMHNGQRQC